MSFELVDDTPVDVRNAATLALACELSYLPETAGASSFRERLGMEARLISVDNTQVYVAENDRSIVVAFRGSEAPSSLDGFKDWLLTNASNFLILPEGRIGTDFAAAGVGARFHKGFLQALDEVWEPLRAAVEGAISRQERPLWLTGHSLGGALALLAAWRFLQNFVAVHEVYTFGAPMVGNDAAAEAFQREFPGKIHRYVDAFDLVPKLPMLSLISNAYAHCLAEQLLGEDATAEEAESAASTLKALAGKSVDGLLNTVVIDDLWGCIQSRIAHHMVANYQQRIEARRKAPA